MLITLEGIEGAGKTTQLSSMARYLQARGCRVVVTREPGGTAVGRRIRSILLDPRSRDLVPTAELLLYIADRVQHLQQLIEPELAAGKVVLCDRFYDATLVYQGYGRGLDRGMIQALHRLTCGGVEPDATFLLDLAPQEGLQRAWNQLDNGSRTDGEARFEKEALEFHQRVRAGYLEVAQAQPGRFRIIDAAQSEPAVTAQILELLDELLI
jgi:dTMP kinase